jgi:hypothetical protein
VGYGRGAPAALLFYFLLTVSPHRFAMVSPTDGRIEPSHSEVLWKVISRFDTYAGTTNAKAGLVLTFNSFAVTALALKSGDVIEQFTDHPGATKWVAMLLAIATISALGSIAFAFAAAAPYLGSPKSPGKYHSILFFEHVAEHASGADYLAAVTGHNEPLLLAELATQARAVASGVKNKFRRLRLAVWLILGGVLLPMALVVVTRLVLLLFLNS